MFLCLRLFYRLQNLAYLSSEISNTFNIVLVWRLLSNISLLSYRYDLNEKQYITDMSLISMAFVHLDVNFNHLSVLTTLLLPNISEIRLCHMIGFDLMFNAIAYDDIDFIENSVLTYSAAINKSFKINIIYLILLRNRKLKLLPKYLYGGMEFDLLLFTPLEISYLVNKQMSHPFLNMIKTAEEKATIPQLMVACLHNNTSNVKLLCSMGKHVQSSKMAVCDLVAFYSKEDIIELNIPILEAISSRHVYGTFNELHVACLKGNKTIMRHLLRITYNIDARSYISPHHISIMCGKLKVYDHNYLSGTVRKGRGFDTEYLLDSIFLPMEVNVVHLICFLHDIEFLRFLIQMKCDLHVIAKLPTISLYYIDMLSIYETRNILSAVSEMTPLHIACMLDKDDFVECILSNTNRMDVLCSIHSLHLNLPYHVDISELLTDRTSFTLTALHTAILCKNTNIAKTLIAKGADTENTANTFMEICIDNDTLYSTRSKLKPLHLACLVKNKVIFETILTKASLENLNQRVELSYSHFCYLNSLEGGVLSEELDHEIEMFLNVFHIACIIGDRTYAEIVLKANPDLRILPIRFSFKDLFSITKYPLHLAAENGDLDLCKFLLRHGAKIDVTTSKYGLCPWHLALYHGYADLAEFLLTNGRNTHINKTRFMFMFMLFLMRAKFSRIILPFIAKSRKSLILTSVYIYLMYVFSFPVYSKTECDSNYESIECLPNKV